MSSTRPAVALLLVVFVLASGCGGGTTATPPVDGSVSTGTDTGAPITDVSGWYQVTSDVEGPCGMTKDAPFPLTYVWIERLQNTFIFHVCGGQTEAQCTGTEFYDFTTPIENGLSAQGGGAAFSAGCTLTVERTTLTLVGNRLHAHSLKDSTNVDIPKGQCTLEAAEALTTPCTYEVDVQAMRL
jgi:hypothetical protein